jgi:hypothetical protein
MTIFIPNYGWGALSVCSEALSLKTQRVILSIMIFELSGRLSGGFYAISKQY